MVKPHKIIAIIIKIQKKHKHNDNQLNNEGSHFKHCLNWRYYRFLHIKGKDPKAPLLMTQEGDKRRF
jgi:hypothetical protein